jgi:hypothetical protein
MICFSREFNNLNIVHDFKVLQMGKTKMVDSNVA